MTQLYTKVVAEGSSGVTPVPGAEMMTSFPSSLLPTLSPVVNFLRTLPVPSTHPTHPAAQVILTTLKEAQRGYADMRGNWSVKCLEGQGKRLVARAENVDPLVTGREFGEWVELILGTADVRWSRFLPCILALSVFLGGIQAPSRIKSTIERRARGVSVRNASDSHSQTLQLNIGGPSNAREKVSAQVHLPCPIRI